MATSIIDKERAAFEAFISGPPFERNVERFPDAPTKYAWPCSYRDIAVDLAWYCWQARASLPPENTQGHQAELRGSDSPSSAAEKDAARYRWLRQQEWFSSDLCVLRDPKRVLTRGIGLGADCPSLSRLDTAIDDALAALANEPTPTGEVE